MAQKLELTKQEGEIIQVALEGPREGITLRVLRLADKVLTAIENAKLTSKPAVVELDDEWYEFLKQQVGTFANWNAQAMARKRVIALADKLNIE